MKKFMMTALAGTLLCTTAVAEDWYLYAPTEKIWYFFNLDELQCSGTVCQTWDASIATNKYHDFRLARIAVDCENGRTKSLGEYNYRKGKLDSTIARESAWLYPPPNTVGRNMIVTICDPNSRNPDNYLRFASLLNDVPNVKKAIRHFEEQNQTNR